MSVLSKLKEYFLPGELYTHTSFYVATHFRHDDTCFMAGKQEGEEITVIARWLVRLRWIAICGFLILAFSYSFFPQAVLPIRTLYVLCFILIIYNAAFFLIFQTLKTLSPHIELFCIRLQVLFDWLALFLFIHFTGGILSPLVFFVVLHIIINSMIFSPVQCYWYTTFSIMGLGTLFLLEQVVPSFRVSNPWFREAEPALEFVSMLIAFVLISSVLYTSTFLATSIMSRFRKREDVVRNLSQNLQKALTRMETLYDATTMMVTSYNLQEVLDLLLRDCVRLMEAKGAALRLVQRGTDDLLPVVSYGLSEDYLHKGPITMDDGLVPRTPDDLIVVDDVEKDPRLSYGQESYREGIRSIISLPLVSKGRITGNLRIYARTRHHFTPDEISFLKVLANGAAVILDNVQAWKALEESNRKIVSFTYRVGHDLKSPVAAVQSMLAAMQEGYAGAIPPKQKDILARCINKHDQLLMNIRDLLNMAAGQIPTDGQKIVPICIDAAAAESVKLAETVSRRKGVSLVLLLPQQPIPFEEIPGDFHRLFSNLLDNAIRYTPEGGRVEIGVGCDDRHVTITVRDTGMGIEPEYRERIFEEFFRTPRAKQCLADGTGLGLAIVKGIVDRYHGSIRVESEPGKGTTFFLVFPKATSRKGDAVLSGQCGGNGSD